MSLGQFFVMRTDHLDWPFEVYMNFNKSTLLTFHLREDINDWLKEKHIPYEYWQGYHWGLKNEKDVTMFLLRWS